MQMPFIPFDFFFNDTATTEIYTLSLHDALPISQWSCRHRQRRKSWKRLRGPSARSEAHTSELQSRSDLVCRLLLEKKTKRDPEGGRAALRAEADPGLRGRRRSSAPPGRP